MHVFSYKSFFILGITFTLASCGKNQLFERVNSSSSGITFNNKIVETDSINPLSIVNIYNGGGVGVGDFNMDGLQDLYFTGNMVPNKLYLNKGNLRFEDVTEKANVDGNGKWSRGVAVVDINSDGKLDIYVCATLSKDPKKRENLLYVNQGNDKQGTPQFKEQAAEYGLNDSSHSTMAQFFDYDNDGDLDMYLVVNEILRSENPNRFRPIINDGSFQSTGKLYRNDKNDSLNHPYFTDVSKEAGITIEGYGHGATISDINQDGWKDIYVSNDFVSNNILYINNQNGTFTDQSRKFFKHTAANAMGQDIIDINNDGLPDVIEADMNPEDNYRKKMMMSANSYQTYQNFDYFGYQYQYVRNTLQINQGPRVGQNDSVGAPVFSDVSFLAGIAETDWSWTPLVADFDNDGLRDIIITNGYPRDVTDHDFIAFRDESFSVASKEQLLHQIPVVKLHNYAFKNKGNLEFANETNMWGLKEPTFSNGAVYADLDNDGDLDMVINNINDEAFVYKNNSDKINEKGNNYIQIKFQGNSSNTNGLGASAKIYYDKGKLQSFENTPYRGYLSTVQEIAHFGLGEITAIDSAVIIWPAGKKQILTNIKPNQTLLVKESDAKFPFTYSDRTKFATNAIFKEITNAVGIDYSHQDVDFVDFNYQKLLPHKFSEYTPALAVGDVDNNGLDDVISGGNSRYPAQIFLQQKNGAFIQKSLTAPVVSGNTNLAGNISKDYGLLLFDADKDGDLDLYVASGGYESAPNSPEYQDKLYLNDGKGSFTKDVSALPQNFTSKLCVRASDFDKDGDLDLFVSGRVEPWNYPKPVSSFIFRNDSKNGKVKFTDVTLTAAKDLKSIGLVCDAVFTDFDNDGWQDLLLAGEWMPLTFLKNDKGIFKNVTEKSGISNKIGWWNTIVSGDFDNDGDIDYIAGNQGKNTFYKASEKYPVFITAKDFDNNGSYDAIPSLYLPDQEGNMKEFPAHTRDDMVKQIISMRTRFQNYKSFAVATMDEVLTKEQREGALRVSANYLLSSFIKNEGNGKFSIVPLPQQAQTSVLCGMVAEDFDGDGNLDVVLNGNDFGTEVSVGRYDALNGLFLKGDGKGSFKPLSILQSGIFIPGDGKALVKLRDKEGNMLLAASQNRGPMKILKLKKMAQTINLQPSDISAVVKLQNGKIRKQEFGWGNSFLSQSGRFIIVNESVKSVSLKNSQGNSKIVYQK
ncbi:VCBS repeat-containing protein [Rubrolithibacter danxiaensis]|uniref:VCBS repeat-containing protein n=1 Tax=Rubrolithibacter danxiaensis TaxID=3390805 RepID=UPI003BF86FFA